PSTTTTPAPTTTETSPDPTPAATTQTAAGGELVVPTPGNPPAPKKDGDHGIGTWGFDLAGMNTKIKPGDSFYQYSNGTWLATTPIPEDKSNYGMFTVLSDQSAERTKEIITNAKGKPGSEEKKIADYYASFMDEAAIEKKGI